MPTAPNYSLRASSDQDGERPFVIDYVQKPAFNVGDKVYLLNSDGSRDGPYLIASVPSTGNYTLCLDTGASVRNGDEISGDELEEA
ncbi:hypothetical protein F4776DRAFT_625455 [Hypoxylon sp. NC0597]|nr:hypothetical protein F4776DRAFT_625455 [Hypoxylon sp. NC0597]